MSYEAVFELFQKVHLLIYGSQFMTQIVPLSFVLFNLESGKERKKLQKFEYLEIEKTFLNEIKSIFHSF